MSEHVRPGLFLSPFGCFMAASSPFNSSISSKITVTVSASVTLSSVLSVTLSSGLSDCADVSRLRRRLWRNSGGKCDRSELLPSPGGPGGP
ncbi:hypothetical protein NP493_256g01033 [Ridgeia piscesae]|uniref:Uncharacterized protein n=1 Tax=Ridgeia piscesae TaxID=27915 RepID=A0AAD9NY91_RIDPI|nr:hypothetical protein NP493_256g01033 [Ridgeia piscesae]